MPTDPNNPYVDTPHPRTVTGAGWRYGCHSDKLGPMPRGRTTWWRVQDGWNGLGGRYMIEGATEWIPRACGHSESGDDPACAGCVNRGRE